MKIAKIFVVLSLIILVALLGYSCGERKSIKEYEDALSDSNAEVIRLTQDLSEANIKLEKCHTNISSFQTIQNKQAEIIAELNIDIANRDSTISSLKSDIDKKEKENASLKAEISMKSQESSSSQADIYKKNEEIASLQYQISKKDQEISSLKSNISTKDQEIASLKSTISTKDQEIFSLKSAISAKDQEISSLKSEISKKDEEIKDLKQKLKDASPTVIIYSVDPGDSSSYLSQKFRFDGFNYSADTSWYSDIYCKSEFEVSDVIIISPIVDKIEYNDGYNYYTVYACMSNKGLVYTINYPSLLKIDY